jgi:hypothetical protein
MCVCVCVSVIVTRFKKCFKNVTYITYSHRVSPQTPHDKFWVTHRIAANRY